MGALKLSLAMTAVLSFGRAALALEPAAEVWPQWRGPSRDSRVDQKWPDKLQGALTELWTVKLGPSYSGPIIVGDRVYVTETRDKKKEVVQALDRKSGQSLWEHSWEGSLSVPFFAKANGDWIRSTPAYSDGLLFVGGIRDVLVALNAADGSEAWKLDFVKEFGSDVPAFGCVCSPLVDGDFLYIQAGAAFAKLEKRTGKVVWRSLKDEGGMNGSAFSSPVVATIAGERQIVVQTRTKLCGVDPETGNVLWSQEVPAFRGMNILTPSVVGDTIFTSTYGGKSFLYGVEYADGKFSVREKWINKVQGYMSSPVILGNDAYLHLRNQRCACIDLETGKERWISKPFGQYWSMVSNGDLILSLDEKGDLILVRKNAEKYDEIDRQHVSDVSAWAHLAVCGGQVFVRELKGLKAYRWTP